MTRSASARTRGSGLHHTDPTLHLAAGRRPAPASALPLRVTVTLTFCSAVGFGAQVFDGNDVQGIQSDDLAIAVHHGKGARGDQDHLGMTDSIFATVRGA
jgi:hypothetical protein